MVTEKNKRASNPCEDLRTAWEKGESRHHLKQAMVVLGMERVDIGSRIHYLYFPYCPYCFPCCRL